MSKQNVPELRFPEFSGEWDKRKLNEISDKVREKNKDMKISETLTNSAQFGIVSQRDYFDKDISSLKSLSNYYVVKPDDFVYNPRISKHAPVGPVKRNKLNRLGVMSPLYYVFRTKDVDKEFLEYYFETTKWHKFMYFNGDTGARSDRFSIKDSVFQTMDIPYPEEVEQRKIGNLFKKIDRLIELEEKKLELLEEQKKEYMQKIFSQELRFKDENSNDYPEWENSHLNKITNINPPEEIKNKEFIYVDLESVEKGRLRNINIIKLADAPSRAKRVLNNQDVLFQTVRPYQKNHLLVINETSNFPMIASTGFAQLRSGSNLVPAFLYHLIHSEKFSLEVAKRCTGTSYPAVLSSDLGKIEVSYPIIEEQKKIGEFFNEIDELINHIQQKAKKLIQLKNGLLSRLFL